MAIRKRIVTPLLTHWSYVSVALSHRYEQLFSIDVVYYGVCNHHKFHKFLIHNLHLSNTDSDYKASMRSCRFSRLLFGTELAARFAICKVVPGGVSVRKRQSLIDAALKLDCCKEHVGIPLCKKGSATKLSR